MNYITSYSDFPNKGIVFKDLLGLIQEPNIFKALIDNMASNQKIKDCDAIIAIEARGFIFGSAIALRSGKPMVVVRKPNKLPGELLKKKYKLEYGSNQLSIQKDSITTYQKFHIVDDVLATGGSVNCVSDLLLSEGKEVNGCSVVLEIKSLKGRNKLDMPLKSQLEI